MAAKRRSIASTGARAAVFGTCEQCGTAFDWREGRRFCTGACRARFSREKHERETAAEIARLKRLAGVRA